tara:strand:+ start:425 stop:724 length:300 start_codon:yes stop_codon:yes gene_type:complete
MYIGHKVTIKRAYHEEEALNGKDIVGVVVDANRDHYGNLNTLYVMSIEKDGMGYIYSSPLQDIIFHDGKKVIEDIKNPYDKLISQAMGMMLSSGRVLEA